MAKPDYQQVAEQVLSGVGGKENISSATHCITRLRLKLKDTGKADKTKIESINGVLSVVEAGGQFQVVIGDDVPEVYERFTKAAGIAGDGEVPPDDEEKGNLLNRFIQLISSIFLPILWTLAGVSLIKAFLAMAVQLNWIDTAGSNYAILNAASDAVFYFLPIFLAVTAAERFKANQFTAMAIAGALVYPSIVALSDASGVTFLGIPVVMMSYTSSVIPILFAVWIQGHLERWVQKVLPSMIRNFTTPLLVTLVMVPLALIVVGPITTLLADGISSGVQFLFVHAPWAAGAVVGGFWQVLVIFGLHWGLVPVMINDLATLGYSLLAGPIPAAVLAQAAAAIAVAIRTKSKARRGVAIPGAVSGILAGVTEPIIYGVNLPMRRPFYFGVAGGAIGGMIAAIGGAANSTFVVPSLLSLPAYLGQGSFATLVIGILVGMAVAFFLTLFFGVTKDNDKVDEAPVAADAIVEPGANAALVSPVNGQLIALADVQDKAFASGVLGSGVGVIPSDGAIVSPVTGTVITAFPTGHAYGIRSEEGIEVLIHIGIDTVSMKGDGFTPQVAKGDHVSAGDPIASVDLKKVTAAGFDPTVIMVVTNSKKLGSIDASTPGQVTVGVPVLSVSTSKEQLVG
ncbi:beta-glucoside-specific PTS transporter subunit IIABC [Changpingibacter yushuensis]|uniref:beta-glucoside-specific PTS transporter subunit IIABC n=1 Tax=Changpingibacter yushuensis TaxID=2758440 RepID=UPI0015F4EA11|nr:beta-glucoside-specific PTS transporter subunit IIABC [Changpingibacter yushuensis]